MSTDDCGDRSTTQAQLADRIRTITELLIHSMRRYDHYWTTQADVAPGGRWPLTGEMIGETIGLRKALCVLMGWDPDLESHKEGKADTYAYDWWCQTHPDEEWELPL